MYKHAGFTMVVANELLGQNRKENYELFILDSCTNSSACSIFIYGAMGVNLSPGPGDKGTPDK